MATIDDDGEIRDGRNRKVHFTLCVQSNNRFIYNCSKCGDDFRDESSSKQHFERRHSHLLKANVTLSQPANSEMTPSASKDDAERDETAKVESASKKCSQHRIATKKSLQRQSIDSIQKQTPRRGRSAAKVCVEKLRSILITNQLRNDQIKK